MKNMSSFHKILCCFHGVFSKNVTGRYFFSVPNAGDESNEHMLVIKYCLRASIESYFLEFFCLEPFLKLLGTVKLYQFGIEKKKKIWN